MTQVYEYAISLPFTITAYGTVDATGDQRKIWADRVLSAIGTGWGERVLRYEFGTKIHAEVYNTITAAESTIKLEVSRAFNEFLPLLTLDEVITTYSPETNSIKVDVTYKLPNQSEDTLTVGNVSIKGNLPPKEN
jgi:phage baseplate assembly protein W